LEPLRDEIRLEGVSLSYTPERRALDQVDVTIEAGTRVAFVGPSGSGKSTILRILMRLYEPDEGKLTVDGVDVRDRSLSSLRSQLGVVFQDSFLFDATVRENIAMGAVGATEAQIMAAAEAAEVETFVGNLSRGYDTLVGEFGRNLSGGQRQRVAIARALIGDPRILLLDEATSALDPATERQISETLANASAGRTVVAITHRLTSVVDYDRIYVVDNGRIAESGTHRELISLGGVYARLWAEQTGEAIPEPRPFDLAAAVAKLPFFVDMAAEDLPSLVARFDRVTLASGSTVAEGGQLVVIGAGRGEIQITDRVGTSIRQVGIGETFGLNALLGEPTGAILQSLEPMTLFTLSADALDELRSQHREIEAAATGRSTVAPSPNGRMLARATVGVGATPNRSGASVTERAFTAADVAAEVAAARRTHA
jgi:ABC-type multidrug transport system ATPase subunit